MFSAKIREIRNLNNMSQKDFAKAIGTEFRTLQDYEYGKTQPRFDFLKKLIETFDIDPSFLFDESSAIDYSPQSPHSPLPKISISPLGDTYTPSDEELCPLVEASSDYSDVIMLPVFADGRVSAGFGEPHNDGTIYFLPQSKSFLKTKFNLSNTGALGIIQAIGNSMNPTISEGDLLLFQCDGSAYEGGIYIIELEGDYFVKRLIKRPSIKLISDNPIYEPIEIQNLQEIRIIGRVVGVISNLRF